MGKLSIVESGSDVTIVLDANAADVSAGGKGQDGSVIIRDKLGHTMLAVRAGQICIYGPDGAQRFFVGATGDLVLGGNGVSGDLALVPAQVSGPVVAPAATLVFHSGRLGAVLPGGNSGVPPTIAVHNILGKETIQLNGDQCSLTLRNAAGRNTIFVDGRKADLTLGGAEEDGAVVIRNGAGKDTIRLDGATGDVVLENADCAEDFDIAADASADAGTVMVIDEDGTLRPSSRAYDKRVAGVVSGGGDLRPGIVLGRRRASSWTAPLALMGRVYCKVDAQCCPVEVGDLLTTSPTAGHAMKAQDPSLAFGAVIGKALRAQGSGLAQIPILVALQ